MVDINEKFRRIVERNQRAADLQKRRLARQMEKQMVDARLIESFMNIHQLEKTGLCADFVAQYYEKKKQELGEEKVKSLKSAAARYIGALKSNGQIYEHISWFRFVMDNYGR